MTSSTPTRHAKTVHPVVFSHTDAERAAAPRQRFGSLSVHFHPGDAKVGRRHGG
jgi:hypothetical protein